MSKCATNGRFSGPANATRFVPISVRIRSFSFSSAFMLTLFTQSYRSLSPGSLTSYSLDNFITQSSVFWRLL